MNLGLALGSGGARGFAHVGVAKALAERGIVPAAIAGTSMGAIVGASLAAGTFDTLLSLLAKLDMGDATALFMDFSFGKPGLVKGDKVMDFLSTFIPDVTFDKLEIPFAVMATDISTGKAVTLSRGKVLPAVRASISIPGVFTPVKRGSLVLVDGGLSSPVPVDTVRNLGATAVLAVNVDGGPPCPYNSRRLPAVVNRVIGFGEKLRTSFFEEVGRKIGIPERGIGLVDMLAKTTRICENRIAALEIANSAPEWLLEPAVGDVPTLDFSRVDDAIRAGYEAASQLGDIFGK